MSESQHTFCPSDTVVESQAQRRFPSFCHLSELCSLFWLARWFLYREIQAADGIVKLILDVADVPQSDFRAAVIE